MANVFNMTHEQLQREANYRAALSALHFLHNADVITDAEARRIEQILRDKFSPVWAAIA